MDTDKALRDSIAKAIEGLGAVVFASDPKEREMLAKPVVLTVVHNAPRMEASSE